MIPAISVERYDLCLAGILALIFACSRSVFLTVTLSLHNPDRIYTPKFRAHRIQFFFLPYPFFPGRSGAVSSTKGIGDGDERRQRDIIRYPFYLFMTPLALMPARSFSVLQHPLHSLCKIIKTVPRYVNISDELDFRQPHLTTS